MPSKTSFFNKGIFFNNIKRFWLITFSYTFFLLLFVMGYLNSAINRLENTFELGIFNDIGLDIFSQSGELMTFFLGFYTLVTALAMFSYMQFPKNTAMVHSLPLRRETLFMTNYLSGLFIVTFPLIFNTVIVLITQAVTGFSNLTHGLLWLGVNLVLTFLLYSFAVFAGMFTGHMAAQAIFFFIFNFLALFLESMINSVLSDFLFGFSSNESKFEAWSPLYYILGLFSGFARGEGNVAAVTGYMIAGLLFMVSAFFLYKKRHMEVATDVISFQVVKPIFKYSVSFCSSALLGSILVNILDIRHSLVPYILTYLVGGLIGYFSSEMLLRKTFKVFKAYKGFLVFALILSLLLCSIYFDFYGYESYVPQDREVELMAISDHSDPVLDIALWPETYDPNQHRYMLNFPEFNNNPPQVLSDAHIKALRKHQGVTESREAITKARLIHSYITENQEYFRKNRSYLYDTDTIVSASAYKSRALYFIYRLKDGRRVERYYPLIHDSNNTEFDQLLRDYLSLPDIREKYEPLLSRTAQDIRSVRIHFTNREGQYTSHEIEDIDSFLAAYKKDILEKDPLEILYPTYPQKIYSIELSIEFQNNELYNYGTSFSRSLGIDFQNTVSLLKNMKIITEEQIKELELQYK